MAKELRVIAPIVPAGDFEVANAKDIKAGDKRLDVALAEAAAEVAKKANKTDVNNELNKKASTEYVNAELSKKADKTDVDAELVTKANKIDTETALAGKASVEGLASANEAIADLSTEQAALSARMDTFTRLEEGSTTGDAELADGRVGADGKTYENIGGAIRGQVTDLKSDLSNYPIVDCTSDFKGGYIKTNLSIGAVVDTTAVSNKAYNHIRVTCSRGDVFELTGTGADAARIITFTDENNIITYSFPSSFAIDGKKIVAPNDGYLIVNVAKANTYTLKKFKNDNINVLSVIDLNDFMLNSGYITTGVNVGETINFAVVSSEAYRWGIVPCRKGDQLLITEGFGADQARLWAFTDTNKKLISKSGISEHINARTGARTYIAPADGYLIVNQRSSDSYSFTWKSNYIDITEIEENFNNIARAIDHTNDLVSGYIKTDLGSNEVVNLDTPVTAKSYKCYSFEVNAGDYIVLTGTGALEARLWAFTDADKKMLSVAMPSTSVSNLVLEAAVDGYFILNVKTANTYSITHIVNEFADTVTRKEVARDIKYYMRTAYQIGYANTPRYLNMVNYLGNPQNVHPKVLYIPSGFCGHKYWMAYTPYPYGSTEAENPCIAYSDDGYRWRDIPGNPLATGTSGDYYSDTHLVLRDATLECWYREANSTDRIETIWRKTSTDGVTWSSAEKIMESSESLTRLLSPAVIWNADNNKYMMWVVSSKDGYAIKYLEGDSNAQNWSEIRRIPLSYSYNGKNYNPWHLDVIIDNNNYIALVMCKGADDNNDWLLFITTSTDNENYISPYVVMVGNPDSWDNKLYRSSIVKVGDYYRIYYSAKNKTMYFIGITESKTLDKFIGAFDELSAYSGRYTSYPT